jgi:acyl-CoA thioesterase-2
MITRSSMMDSLLVSLELEPTVSGALRTAGVDDGHGRRVVFGGEMLGQAIVAAGRAMPSKLVKSVQTIFARGAHTGSPLDVSVETMHEGRNLGSVTVTFAQEDQLCARALVLMDVEDTDLVRHQPRMPQTHRPDASSAVVHLLAAPETIVVGDVDINDPALTGPPTLQLWVRFRGAPAGDATVARALLAYATDGWLLATAMRPHPGIGQAMAHREMSTGVVSHALSFHDDFDANEWLLIDHESLFAGRGRCYGRANVFTENRRLVASFTQEALLRHFPAGQDPRGREATIF